VFYSIRQEEHSEFKTETNIACHKSEGQSDGELLEIGALAEQQKTQQEFLFSVACLEVNTKRLIGSKFGILSGKLRSVLRVVFMNLNPFVN
jgi:hypothetical protein